MFKEPFSFDGRIRRTEIALTYLIYCLSGGIIQLLMELNDKMSFLELALIPLVWFMLAQNAKRCHDRGNSGWYQIIPFYIFWLLFADSNYGKNEYGLNPKGIGNDVDIFEKHLVE